MAAEVRARSRQERPCAADLRDGGDERLSDQRMAGDDEEAGHRKGRRAAGHMGQEGDRGADQKLHEDRWQPRPRASQSDRSSQPRHGPQSPIAAVDTMAATPAAVGPAQCRDDMDGDGMPMVVSAFARKPSATALDGRDRPDRPIAVHHIGTESVLPARPAARCALARHRPVPPWRRPTHLGPRPGRARCRGQAGAAETGRGRTCRRPAHVARRAPGPSSSTQMSTVPSGRVVRRGGCGPGRTGPRCPAGC